MEESNEPLGPDPHSDLRARYVNLSTRKNKHGGYNLSGALPVHVAALLGKYLNTHAVKGDGIELPDGMEDQRTIGQRNCNTFSRMVHDAIDVEPASLRGQAAITVVFPARPGGANGDDRDGAHSPGAPSPGTAAATMTGTTNVGIPMTLAQVLRLGLANSWYAALLPDTGSDAEGPVVNHLNLRLGRLSRTANSAQRLAALILDGCCQHPGCTAPLDECDMHHITSWMAGGRTDIENLAPLCRHHHTINDDSGVRTNRGHMTPRDPARGFRTGWAGPTGPARPGEPGRRQSRRVTYNNTPPARSAPGHRHGERHEEPPRPHPPPGPSDLDEPGPDQRI